MIVLSVYYPTCVPFLVEGEWVSALCTMGSLPVNTEAISTPGPSVTHWDMHWTEPLWSSTYTHTHSLTPHTNTHTLHADHTHTRCMPLTTHTHTCTHYIVPVSWHIPHTHTTPHTHQWQASRHTYMHTYMYITNAQLVSSPSFMLLIFQIIHAKVWVPETNAQQHGCTYVHATHSTWTHTHQNDTSPVIETLVQLFNLSS